jgi:DNA repair protein RecN (Recombination protein N)
VTLALVKQAGELLVDLHGQHEHQSLLRVDTHIDMLDDFGGLDGIVEAFQAAYKKLRDLNGQLQELRERGLVLNEKLQLYQFQIQEINSVMPEKGEEDELIAQVRILENAETLLGTTARLYDMLYEGDRSAHDLLVLARNTLHDLEAIDAQFQEAAKECSSAEAVVGELAKVIQAYNARVESNPERLAQMRERLGKLSHLKKKYGGSLEAVIAHRQKAGQEIALAEDIDAAIRRLVQEVEEQRTECADLALRLSSKRKEVARRLDKAVVVELEKLGIQNASFAVRIGRLEVPLDDNAERSSYPDYIIAGKKAVRLHEKGYDAVEFYISLNLGEELKPLAVVASGGEVSRIMLALKSILAKSDRLPVLIFDEIDVGVSGRVAQAVGMSLKSLAGFHQVIAITHLPQIAGLADSHFMVFKSEDASRTRTSMKRLSSDERVREIAGLMSGAEVTEAGLRGARELMNVPSDN